MAMNLDYYLVYRVIEKYVVQECSHKRSIEDLITNKMHSSLSSTIHSAFEPLAAPLHRAKREFSLR